jgi:hypothetical protein
MSMVRRASYGALSGIGGTIVLSGFRKVLSLAGLVGATAPEQVVAKLEDLGLIDDCSPEARRLLVVATHLSYGAGIGAILGLLRRERGESGEEAAVGTALGILTWAANWTVVLPPFGVHRPPWRERTPKVILPVLDHAVFGAVWGLVYRSTKRDSV